MTDDGSDLKFKEGAVRRPIVVLALILACLLSATAAYGQKGCELTIVGTWATPDRDNPAFYRFGPDGTVKALSKSEGKGELREIASASYTLDDPKAPKVVLIREAEGTSGFPLGTTSLDVTGYDDTSVTVKLPGQKPARWSRVDPYRYFMVLAGRIRTFYDGGGPTFPMLIKTDGRKNQIDAVGLYPAKGTYWDFGPVPAETYNQFMKEPRSDSEVMLRLEITSVQYERALKIVRTWERRVRENALLYPDLPMDNILLVKQVTETLNQCGERIKLYKLDWSMADHISDAPLDNPLLTRIPFEYFKELRRLNESLHVGDDKFHAVFGSKSGPQGP
jgi:hypothetical protein